MAEQKRGRGRPRKLPDGTPHGVRCTLVNGEMEKFRRACRVCKVSQTDFSRAAVLHAVDTVFEIKPATEMPSPKKKK